MFYVPKGNISPVKVLDHNAKLIGTNFESIADFQINIFCILCFAHNSYFSNVLSLINFLKNTFKHQGKKKLKTKIFWIDYR